MRSFRASYFVDLLDINKFARWHLAVRVTFCQALRDVACLSFVCVVEKLFMNWLLKILPLFSDTKALKGKKRWIGLVLLLLTTYQTFSPNGYGAKWGIPSYDTFYQEPRDVLITRVEAASDAQEETAEEFRSALEEFKAVTGFDGGDLEAQFNRLNAAYKSSESSAQDVTFRVNRVVGATNRLLTEWRAELDEYHDPAIKRRAEAQFDVTRQQADNLIAAMRRAESKTEPVLGAFRDQVLFLKHNLNMQAISSLQLESASIEQDVSQLIAEMEASIAEASSFVEALAN